MNVRMRSLSGCSYSARRPLYWGSGGLGGGGHGGILRYATNSGKCTPIGDSLGARPCFETRCNGTDTSCSATTCPRRVSCKIAVVV